MKKISILLLLILFCSCSLIHFISVKDKAFEPRENFQKYIDSFGYDSTYSYQLLTNFYDSISLLPYTINTYKLAYNTKASPIQIRVYDSTGKFLNGYEQCFGDFKKTHILDSFPLKKISHFPINYNLSLAKDLKLFVNNLTDQKTVLNESKNKTYTFIVFYAQWAGYYSSDVLKRLKKHLKTHKDKVLLLKVNTSPHLQ